MPELEDTAVASKDEILCADVVIPGPKLEILSGIGCVLATDTQKGLVRIDELMPKDSAEKAGLREMDIVRSIDGKDVSDVPLHDIHRWLLGAPGSKVHLLITREGPKGSKNMEFYVKRSKRGELTGFHRPESNGQVGMPQASMYRTSKIKDGRRCTIS